MGVWTAHLTPSHFLNVAQLMTRTRVAQVVSLPYAHRVMSHLHALMCLFWLSSTTPLSSLRCPSSLLSSCPSSCPSTSSSTMRWTNSMCTFANEDLGTLAEVRPCHKHQTKLDPCWKSQPVTCIVHMEWKLELNLYTKTILTRGSEFLMAWRSWSRVWATTRRTTTTSRKPLKCSSKIFRWNRMYLLLRADQRLKQNHEDVFLPAHPQELYPLGEELGPILNHKMIRPSIIQCRNNWVLFFVMVIFFEKTMERLNSGDWRIIFGTNLSNLNIGLMKSGWAQWQKAEETRKDIYIVLIHQEKTRNLLSPSSSRTFKTQTCWSFITGQCINPKRFHRVHLSRRKCDQFTFHQKFRIDTGRTKFEQKTDGLLSACGSHGQKP